MSQVLRSNTHTHTHTHRRGRQAGEMRRRGPNTIRRGEAGVESNHTWRGRPLPAQNHKSRRDRERNDRETGERGERRERGDRTQGSLRRKRPSVGGPQIVRTSDHSPSYDFLRGTVQYVRFPGGPPPEYWTRPWLLSFGDRTGSGVSNQV